ncbi:MAG: NPCBM/NEW2 domain-containing protein [Pirellulaceae bacterium]
MRASRRRCGNCLLMVLASLVVLAGLAMTVVGGVIFVHTSQQVGVLGRAYDRAMARAKELNRMSEARGPRRDPIIDVELENQLLLVEKSRDMYLEAKEGQKVGGGVLAGGLVMGIFGGGLFVFSIVLRLRRRAPSSPPPTRHPAGPSTTHVAPWPTSGPARQSRPSRFPWPAVVVIAIVGVAILLAPVGVYAVIQMASNAPSTPDESETPAAEDGAPAKSADRPETEPAPTDPAPPKPASAKPAPPTPAPSAPAPLNDDEQYLRHLAAAAVNTIADKRNHPIDRGFSVGKVAFEHGVYLHPPTANSSAEASYELKGQYKQLRGAVGMIDKNIFGRSMTPLTYKLLGDGKELWRSQPLQTVGQWESFDVDLTGVERLTLKVDCAGDHTGAGGAWLDPILVRAASAAPVASVKPLAQDAGPAEAGAPDPGDTTAKPVPPRDRLRPLVERRRGRVDGVSLPREEYPAPPPAETPGEGERYLRDLKPAKVDTHFLLKLDRTFKLADVEYQHGVSLCLKFPGRASQAAYDLDKSYSRLRGAAGVPDNKISGCKSPMTISILADGAEVWSERMQHSGQWAPFDIDLTGVRQLQLSVKAEGNVDGGHAVWLDPVLVE